MNVDYQTETEQFGAWEAAWSKHCPEIDRRIVRFMEDSPSFSPESLAILTSEISDWLDTRQIKSGARVAQDDYTKENAQDFALWKAAKPEDEAIRRR